MKKFVCGMLAAISMISLFSACNEPLKEPPQIGFLVAAQFSEYKLGVVDGMTDKKLVTDNIENPEISDFASVKKGVSALKNGKLHGLVVPAAYVDEILADNENMSKLYLTFIESKPCAITLAEHPFVLSANAAITDMTRNGKSSEIARFHLSGGKDADYTRPQDYDKVEGRVLRVGVSTSEKAPLVYKDKDGNLTGINVDTAYEIAKFICADIKFIEYKNNDELFAAVDADEIDIAFANFIPSEENPISSVYLYSHPYTDQSVEIIINGKTPEIANGFGAVSETVVPENTEESSDEETGTVSE